MDLISSIFHGFANSLTNRYNIDANDNSDNSRSIDIDINLIESIINGIAGLIHLQKHQTLRQNINAIKALSEFYHYCNNVEQFVCVHIYLIITQLKFCFYCLFNAHITQRQCLLISEF